MPVGYKVVRYDLDENGNVLSQQPTDFITGWLDPSTRSSTEAHSKSSGQVAKTLGRPVDLKFSSDGTLYISDDASGVIYKVTSK